MIDYTPLLDTLKSTPLAGWHTTLAEGLQARLAELQHGDLERWQQSLRNLPPLDGVQHDFSRGVKLTGAPAPSLRARRPSLKEIITTGMFDVFWST